MRLIIGQLNSILLAAFALASSSTAVCALGQAFQPGWIDSRQIGPFIIQATFDLKPYEKLFAELPELQRTHANTRGGNREGSDLRVSLRR
jgi:hypothetical protein